MPYKNKNNTFLQSLAEHPIKRKLHWTGWLQYAPSFVLATLSLLTSSVFLRMAASVSLFFRIISFALYAITIFDIVTVKGGIRPFERAAIFQPKPMPQSASIFDVIHQRHSCRSFQNRKMSIEHRKLLLQLAEESLADCKSQIRFEYVQSPFKVWPTVGAQEFLVVIGPADYERDAVLDVGRCLEKVVLEATRHGLNSCWIGPGTSHESVIEALGSERFDKKRDHIILSCAFGYRSFYQPLLIRMMVHIGSKKRRSLETLFFSDNNLNPIVDFDALPVREYKALLEACRWSPSSLNEQPVRAILSFDNENDVSLRQVDFFFTSSSRYYDVIALGIWLCHWELCCNEMGLKGLMMNKNLEVNRFKNDGAKIPLLLNAVTWRRAKS